MNRNLFKFFLILVVLTSLVGGSFSIKLAKAESALILKVIKECDIQYSGDSCVVELELSNNTGEILDGEAILEVNYGSETFDGIGIEVYYREKQNKNWLKTGWDKEQKAFVVDGFKIVRDKTNPEIKIKTHPLSLIHI